MSTSRTPVRTRWQAVTSEDDTLLSDVLEELQQLREERRRDAEGQQQFREELEVRLRERDETLQRLQERTATRPEELQLSPPQLYSVRERTTNVSRCAESDAGACGDRAMVPMRLKPDTYDGTAPLREFLSQFMLIARANAWDDATRAVALASSLRGRARSILNIDDVETLLFGEIRAKLELQFGESELTQDYYLQFTNRRQRSGEDYPTLGADLERLSRRAYPECTHAVRDKIACSQFVAALFDGFVKHYLQVEGVTSLHLAIERAKTLKFINDSSPPKGGEK